ncbi:hypothetical protein CTP10_R47340 [Cupriavidus sp. P-10]|uniref:hypothetical protein n=1 Tax=Cupriavidus sp. P-10 TaxID=2027911 RepID=UPI0011C0E202|nr:hypothetical protein [Cupriavidus sp. P-10]BDB27329.1 hypothetical protein CTP10_R47340 [Cupriavidus sp. P-10]
MSAFNWPVSISGHVLPGKYLPPDLRKLSHAMGIALPVAFAGHMYVVSQAPVEGETGLRADYLQYHHDRLLALMRTMPSDERPAALARQRRQLGETDLNDDEVILICHLIETQLPGLEAGPMDNGDCHVMADDLDVRGAVLRGRVREFFRSAVTLGTLQPWRVSQ